MKKNKQKATQWIPEEDVMELGWKPLGSRWYIKEAPPELPYWSYARLRIWPDISFIKAYRGDRDDYNCEQEYLFQGIIKNKEDLKTIMKLTLTA